MKWPRWPAMDWRLFRVHDQSNALFSLPHGAARITERRRHLRAEKVSTLQGRYCIMTCCCGTPPPATMTWGWTWGRARTSIGKQSTHGSLQATDALGQRV